MLCFSRLEVYNECHGIIGVICRYVTIQLAISLSESIYRLSRVPYLVLSRCFRLNHYYYAFYNREFRYDFGQNRLTTVATYFKVEKTPLSQKLHRNCAFQKIESGFHESCKPTTEAEDLWEYLNNNKLLPICINVPSKNRVRVLPGPVRPGVRQKSLQE